MKSLKNSKMLRLDAEETTKEPEEWVNKPRNAQLWLLRHHFGMKHAAEVWFKPSWTPVKGQNRTLPAPSIPPFHWISTCIFMQRKHSFLCILWCDTTQDRHRWQLPSLMSVCCERVWIRTDSNLFAWLGSLRSDRESAQQSGSKGFFGGGSDSIWNRISGPISKKKKINDGACWVGILSYSNHYFSFLTSRKKTIEIKMKPRAREEMNLPLFQK